MLLGRPRDAETHFHHALADGDRAPHFRALSLCGLALKDFDAKFGDILRTTAALH